MKTKNYFDTELKQGRTQCMWGVKRVVGTGWYYEAAVLTPACIGAMYYGSDGMSVTVVWKGRWHRRTWTERTMTMNGAVLRASAFIRKVTIEGTVTPK